MKSAHNLDILVLFVHPHPRRSRVNRVLREAICDLPGLHVQDLYEEYPDFYVQVEREQALLEAHELIVFQHPVYWYSAPALLKEWQDMVLQYGWAYGKKGDALHGKRWLQAVTMAGSPESYHQEGQQRFSITEFLRPYEATAYTCGMVWLPPFLTYGTSSLDSAAVTAQSIAYREYLTTLRQIPMSD
uniref:Kef-type potassium/proton antiporter accessory protein, CPA2 family n=1 Tax=Candidatus Kentrum sp. MB TaxID=2138164 RepID=A0A451BG81_9GAMM|nr:MAG: Kef-type potassium/proton antiporter accessory protein, CPA2 family [Candidatus Kentron sp. MB]VFK32745.1 MAG: Kef-type potassium/proton antiporter accessory protein, CPA2 family [Candidatus Kentron sp. MB]VFK77304.1 MAG: Kef-type potassium/proton antiporter accessory protein, CPA2 family [Candidatus Kentron sp. MB]